MDSDFNYFEHYSKSHFDGFVVKENPMLAGEVGYLDEGKKIFYVKDLKVFVASVWGYSELFKMYGIGNDVIAAACRWAEIKIHNLISR